MADLKPVYLVAGDDDAKIDAWRGRLRRRAEAEGGPGALEVFEASSTSPEAVAAALGTLSFATGSRYLLVDGVEAWTAGALAPLEDALEQPVPDTVLVLVARGRAPSRLMEAIDRAGGEVREYAGPKPWEMASWTVERAREEGLHLDLEAAKALVAAVGDRRPQRLAREVEKLAVMAHPQRELSADQVERLCAGEATAGAYDLADALVSGDRVAAFSLAQALRDADERPARLAFPIVRRLREVHRAAGMLEGGASDKRVAQSMRMAPWMAKRTIARARHADRDALERAICAFADMEVETRGGAGLDEDTAFARALACATG